MSLLDSQPGQPSILGLLFMGAAVVLTLGFLWVILTGAVETARQDREMKYLRRRGRPARATIVDTAADVTDDRTVWTLFVDYQIDHGEYLHRVKLCGSVSERDYRYPGDQITILYDPLRPGRARAEFRDPDEGFGLSLLVAIIAVAVICGLSAVGSR